jgi:ketosteroid isomerase-like protein
VLFRRTWRGPESPSQRVCARTAQNDYSYLVSAYRQRHAFLAALDAFDRAFIEGRAEEVGTLFADDGQLLLHHQPAIVGRQAVSEAFRETFAAFDTSAYKPTYDTVDVHTDCAYVLGSFTEVLWPREGGAPGLQVAGRVVLFWRREPDGEWRITYALTSRSAPDEEVS